MAPASNFRQPVSCSYQIAIAQAVTTALACVLAAGCSLTPRDVWVFVDNAGGKPMVVTVDGTEAATIAPGDFAKLVYPPGEHRFRITSGEQELCDLVKNLVKSDRVGVCR